MATAPPPPLSSYSAEIIGGNDDILTEILTHLPIQPLLRFKSVSKHFNSLISHPSFSLVHTLRHPTPSPSALFLPLPFPSSSSSSPSFSLISIYSRPLPSPPSLHPCILIQSCNGLFLFLLSGGKLAVVNPTTWHVFILPFDPVVLDRFGQVTGQGQVVVANPTTHIPFGQGQVVVSNPVSTRIPTVQMVLLDPTTSVPIVHPKGQEHRRGVLSDQTTHIPTGQELGQVVLSDSTTDVSIVHRQEQGQQLGQEVLSDSFTDFPSVQGYVQHHRDVVLLDGTTLFDTQIAFEQEDGELVGLNLAFDPARWAHYYLVKVFKHFLDGDDDVNKGFSISVYGSNVHVWRDMVVWFDNVPFDVEFRRGVYWKGRVFLAQSHGEYGLL